MGKGQKSAVLAVAAVAIGLCTTLSGAAIEIASGMFADLRHGICVSRIPGDTAPLWDATFGGGWRPYSRMSCCGGGANVDHATQQCRKLSIIQKSTRKRLANPVKKVKTFGWESSEYVGDEPEVAEPSQTVEQAHSFAQGAVALAEEAAPSFAGFGSSIGLEQQHAAVVKAIKHKAKARSGHGAHSHAARAAQVQDAVQADTAKVRSHMSHLFGPDPSERWAEEAAPARRQSMIVRSSLAEESEERSETEVAVNEGVVQTQTESAGSLEPVYEWVPWEHIMQARGPTPAFLIYVLGTAIFGLIAALITRWRPAARGSGIPEVKAAVSGVDLPLSFQPKTLVAKMMALSLCVGAGLAVGKEGPMIHIGACWSVLITMLISRLRGSKQELDETDLLCIGSAAGVSAAFGAPLGGVLFAVEELGPTLPTGLRHDTMISAFGSAVVAALALKWLDLTKTHRLTLFEVDYKQAWAPWEAVPFCILGVVGGIIGGIFVLANGAVQKRRLRAEAEGRSLLFGSAMHRFNIDPRVLEVMLLAIFTGLSNYHAPITRMLQGDAIRALFSACPSTGHDPTGLCGAEDAIEMSTLLRLLLGASALRFLQTTITFGALTPAGLFVPSLYMGGCLGRALGALLKYAGFSGAAGGLLEPGIYAMVGAGAVLSGVSRLTLSLAVVLFELTGGLTYVVPFMLAVLIAKCTGDLISNGQSIYDVHADLKGYNKASARTRAKTGGALDLPAVAV